MQIIVMLAAQWYRVVIAILHGGSPCVAYRPQMVSICYGVATNATAMAFDHGHVLLASEAFRFRQ